MKRLKGDVGQCPECGAPMLAGERECEAANCLYLAPEIDVSDWEEFQKRKQEAKDKEKEKISEDWETYKEAEKDPQGRVLAHIELEDAEKIIRLKSTVIKEGTGPTMSFLCSRQKQVFQRCTFNYRQWVPALEEQGKPGGTEENYISYGLGQPLTIPQNNLAAKLSGSGEALSTGMDEWPLGIELGLLAMRKGEIRTILCPPELAWGDTNIEFIPQFSFVVFKLELLTHKGIRLLWAG
jgi:hypothetical protein